MPLELIQNLAGDAFDRLQAAKFDTGVLRPFVGHDGRSYITRMVYNDRSGKVEPKVFLANTPATLSLDAWKLLDGVVIRAFQERLRAFADIRAAGLEYNLPNGMAHSLLQYQTIGDISPATLSMDPVRRSEGDRPEADLVTMPLPVIHKDFDFSAREIEASRQGIMALDTTTAELATDKCAELLEQITVGTAGTFTYGGGTIYGYTNFPNRATKTDMAVPTGANGTTVINNILTLRQLLIDDDHFGPYMLYVNSQWSEFLDNDFSTTKGDQTLRQRILSIEGIQGVRTLDQLPSTKHHMLLVEMKSSTVRAVIGLEPRLVQWDSVGGFMKHFKVLMLQLPQLRADTDSNSGVAHGTTSP